MSKPPGYVFTEPCYLLELSRPSLAASAEVNPLVIKWFHGKGPMDLSSRIRIQRSRTKLASIACDLPDVHLWDTAGANMATVLFTMASFGSFLGWKIR